LRYQSVFVHAFTGYQYAFRHYMRSKRSCSGAVFWLGSLFFGWDVLTPSPYDVWQRLISVVNTTLIQNH
jgi:hypothetical protein